MSHHRTPLSMVTRSVLPHEWRVGDKREELSWIRAVEHDGRPTFVCVTRSGWVVAGGDTLRDAADAFLAWTWTRVCSERMPQPRR